MVVSSSEVSSKRGVVSAGHPLAVEAGLDALERGGTAVDATVAAAFVSFVAEPNNAGVGGYGCDRGAVGGASARRSPAVGRAARAGRRARRTRTRGELGAAARDRGQARADPR